MRTTPGRSLRSLRFSDLILLFQSQVFLPRDLTFPRGHDQILTEMLNDGENRYCAECLSKGPRWASWNLGIFCCIRCSGIHRNLGVHISKVRSVNLDTWSDEQIESMLTWGNLRAAEFWEYHLPKDFKRPAHSDQEMETFIRNKYERGRYKRKPTDPPMDQGARAQTASVSSVPAVAEETKKKDRKASTPDSSGPALQMMPQHFATAPPSRTISSSSSPTPSRSTRVAAVPAPVVDLLSLDVPVATARPAAVASAPAAASGSLLDDDFFNQMKSTSNPSPASSAPVSALASAPASAPVGKSKDDIMSLFNQPSPAATPFAMQNGYGYNNPFASAMPQPGPPSYNQMTGGFGAPMPQGYGYPPGAFAAPGFAAPGAFAQAPAGYPAAGYNYNMQGLQQGMGQMSMAPTGATLDHSLWR